MIYIEDLTKKTSQKEQSEIGRKLLLRGLQTEYGITQIPEIFFAEFGKPFFKSHPQIHFNISHCQKAVACILSHNEVGIDVESINPFDKDLAEYISNDEELKWILNHHDPALAFTILWTKKESYCKLIGQGLNNRKDIQEILQIGSSFFQTIINKAGGYVLTSCSI
ncbi:MAG: 4'-phosphopantetheinyl transferase superfamily protein [Muribaculaceae bacterium]|nr:4'-phosphopantetheinyl transferase superfamily protein [Muribaculaceae bacterium]